MEVCLISALFFFNEFSWKTRITQQHLVDSSNRYSLSYYEKIFLSLSLSFSRDGLERVLPLVGTRMRRWIRVEWLGGGWALRGKRGNRSMLLRPTDPLDNAATEVTDLTLVQNSYRLRWVSSWTQSSTRFHLRSFHHHRISHADDIWYR